MDHATIVAYQVGDRRHELAGYNGDTTDMMPAPALTTTLSAPHASCEDLTMRDSPEEEDEEDGTPTPSVSLSSTPSGTPGCTSLAATPTHTSQKPYCN